MTAGTLPGASSETRVRQSSIFAASSTCVTFLVAEPTILARQEWDTGEYSCSPRFPGWTAAHRGQRAELRSGLLGCLCAPRLQLVRDCVPELWAPGQTCRSCRNRNRSPRSPGRDEPDLGVRSSQGTQLSTKTPARPFRGALARGVAKSEPRFTSHRSSNGSRWGPCGRRGRRRRVRRSVRRCSRLCFCRP